MSVTKELIHGILLFSQSEMIPNSMFNSTNEDFIQKYTEYIFINYAYNGINTHHTVYYILLNNRDIIKLKNWDITTN